MFGQELVLLMSKLSDKNNIVALYIITIVYSVAITSKATIIIVVILNKNMRVILDSEESKEVIGSTIICVLFLIYFCSLWVNTG